MTSDQPPAWALRLRAERSKRLWSQKTMAISLRNAADDENRDYLPSLESLKRYVRDYEAGKHQPGDLYSELYCRAFGLSYESLFGEAPPARTVETDGPRIPLAADASSLATWIATTNTSSEALDHIDRSATLLAETHTQRPPKQVLDDVLRLHKQTQALLRNGRQRLRQTRELLRIDSDLLAHACLLLGDLNNNETAAAFGSTSLLFTEEADSNPAIALTAQAKTARWQGRYAESADLARRGFERSPLTPVKVQLASQEANAAALLGDARRAHAALRRAEKTAQEITTDDPGTSAWSFPRPRQAIFALSVAIHTGDPEGALRAAELADTAWRAGDPQVLGTFAQVRLGAAIAHLMRGDLDATIEQVTPILDLPPELRLSTVTGYMVNLDRRLGNRRFQRSTSVVDLRSTIREFNSKALLDKPTQGDR